MSATLTGQTNAYFSDSNVVTGSIQAGTWEKDDTSGCSKNNKKHGDWDCSSLKFLGDHGNDGQEIYATITNKGSDMKLEGKYEVYFIEKGNPKKGTKIAGNLSFEKLNKDQEIKLSFKPTKSGSYKFKAYQHKDHPGKGELWSETITVKDNQITPSNEQEEDVKEPENQVEIKEPKAQEESVTTEPEDIESGKEQAETKSEEKTETKTNSEESIPPVEKVEEQPEKQTKENEANKEPVQAEESAKEENAPVVPENSDEDE